MLRAAHYKPDAADLSNASKSPPKHRSGGILDLALTAADKYALSLLPTALKGTGLAGNDAVATDCRGTHHYPSNGIPPAFKMQRGPGNPLMQTMPAQSLGGAVQQPLVDSRVATSWDASLKEILAALEPDNRTLKPAKLRDHKYPNQNHGMPTNVVIPTHRRELDEALVTLPGGTRRGKGVVPSYTAALKGISRQGRRPEAQSIDVQYDLVPGVKLAWAGPGTGSYSTAGFGSSPKKYTSQLVGRVSPHYSGTPSQQVLAGASAGGQPEPVHLPDISNGHGHGVGHAHQHASFRGSSYVPPSYQTWTHAANAAGGPSHSAHPRKALPYVSSNAPSLAKPLTVQYHPVLKSTSLGVAAGPNLHAQPSGGSPGWGTRSTPQRPATDQGAPYHGVGGLSSEPTGLGMKSSYGAPPYRLPQTPPEVAAEVSRLRHAQELDGVINGVRSDLMQAASPRQEAPVKSKFLQMYEDPNRPLAKLNPKQLLGEMPSPHQRQPFRRQRPPGLSTDKRQSGAGGPSSVSPGSNGRSPMYERRLKPLPSSTQGDGDASSDGADNYALQNLHLQPPELPESSFASGEQSAATDGALRTGFVEPETEAGSSRGSTPRSSQLEREDTAAMLSEYDGVSDGAGIGFDATGEEVAAPEESQVDVAAEPSERPTADAAGKDDAPAGAEGSGQPANGGKESQPAASVSDSGQEAADSTQASQQELDRDAEPASLQPAAGPETATLLETEKQDGLTDQPGLMDDDGVAGRSEGVAPLAAAEAAETAQEAAAGAAQDSQLDAGQVAASEEAQVALRTADAEAGLGEAVEAQVEAVAGSGTDTDAGREAALLRPSSAQRGTEAAAGEAGATPELASTSEAAEADVALEGAGVASDVAGEERRRSADASEAATSSAAVPAAQLMSDEEPAAGVTDVADAGGQEQQRAADEGAQEAEQPAADLAEAAPAAATADDETKPEDAEPGGGVAAEHAVDAEEATPAGGAAESAAELAPPLEIDVASSEPEVAAVEVAVAEPVATATEPEAAAEEAAAEEPGAAAEEAAATEPGTAAEEAAATEPGAAAAEPDPEAVATEAVAATVELEVAAAAVDAAATEADVEPAAAADTAAEAADAAPAILAPQADTEGVSTLETDQAETDQAAAMAPPSGPDSQPAEPAADAPAASAAELELGEASPQDDVSVASPAIGESAVEAAAEASPDTAPEPEACAPSTSYTLPPGVTAEMAEASAVYIQSRARGYLARRQVAALRKDREGGPETQPVPASHPQQQGPVEYDLPPGVTPEMAHAAVVRIQSHARGYFARRQVAELRKGREAGQAALADAVSAAALRKLEGYDLKPGVTPEMAEAAAIRVQAHMRGHLDRRRVQYLRARRAAAASATAAREAEGSDPTGPLPGDNGETTLREAGEEPTQAAAAPAAPVEYAAQEITIDALKAALADDDDEDDVAPATLEPEAAAAPEVEVAAPVDLSDPAAVAAASAASAAARTASKKLTDGGDGVADTTATIDQAAAEASMARLAANSGRTSAMFQGAGAEMRYSDDEASALELMDNLDGLLQGDDEAAAAAAAVAAATSPGEGELVSISAAGVSPPQALGTSGSMGAASPMDVQEPGGVRVLAGKYEVQHVVGEGAYGMVMKCKVRGTEPTQWVAIKEFKIDDNDPDADDVKRTSLREVSVLEALQHPHVVGFVDKFMVGDRLFIVMEFLPCNLLELLEAQPGGMDRDAVRLIMFQLCSAIGFIHTKGMVYRDIKPENLLVDEHGTVKLCDFGFARYAPSGPNSHLTDYVATRWYRAPELLLGPPYRDSTGKHIQYMYGSQVDMWAVGCLMGELLDGEPLFAGDSDLDQLYRVQQILGPMAPGHQYLFYANPHNTGIVFNIKQPVSLAVRYRGKVSDVELSFMSGLLEMDPDKRLTGEQCLQHPYLVDLAMAAHAVPTPSPSISNTPTATNLSLDGTDAGAQDVEPPVPAPEAASGLSRSGEAPGSRRVSVSPAPSDSRRVSDAVGIEKAGSMTRAAGSLTRGGRSLSHGSVSPVLMHTLSSSPVPGRASSILRTGENGQVVIVEGMEEGDEEPTAGVASVKSVSALAEVAAAVSEIEPA